jgi:hypothetical protein
MERLLGYIVAEEPHTLNPELEKMRPMPMPELTPAQKRAYPRSYHDASDANSEEEVLRLAYELLDFEITLNRCWGVNIYIPDLLGNGNMSMGSHNSGDVACQKIMATAEKIRAKYEAEGYTVDFTNGMGDYRDFYFDIAKVK